MVLSIIFLEDKHTLLLHLAIFYEYQQFVQHRICFWIQTPDYKWDKSRDYTCYSQWPAIHYSTFYQFILNMLFNHNVRLTSYLYSSDVLTLSLYYRSSFSHCFSLHETNERMYIVHYIHSNLLQLIAFHALFDVLVNMFNFVPFPLLSLC
jgi:hypothetical protein